jgi:hypothetical protein
MVAAGTEILMVPQRLVTSFQFAAAALGIPAAAVGSYSAYHNYFSSEATCQRLRTNILAVMERRISVESKRTLLRKDVAEFEKTCGEDDPDARTVFHAALQESEHPATAAAPAAAIAGTGAQLQSAAPPPPRQPLPVFGAPGSGSDRGWVALGRRKAGAWVIGFDGYAISETSLPPAGTVLAALNKLPVWSEMQATSNDQTKLQAMLPPGACVRVLAPRRGAGRLWAEIVPASCNGWVPLVRREEGALVANFDGYQISETSLPPAGTVLTAQRQVALWSEPQLSGANDRTKVQTVLPPRACLRVLTTRSGSGRLWAEVAPAACS